MKNNKGITIIALIITIIVMLILAGVALSFTIGEDGVINKAEETEEKQERATERDRIQLAMADAQIKGMKEVTWENFEDSLIKEFGNNAQLVNERKDYFLVKVGENEYTAYRNGVVEDEFKLVIADFEDGDYDITNPGGADSGEFREETGEVTFIVYNDKEFEGVANFPDYIEKDGKRYKVVQIGYHHGYKFSEVILPLGIEKLKSNLSSGGDYTFHVCNNLKKIILSKNITVIGEHCFYVCDNLQEVVMNSKLHTIEKEAFYDCKSLEEITIPKSVTTIGEKIFFECDNLKKIKVENTAEYIKTNLSNLSIYSGIVYDKYGKLVTF